MLLKFLSSIEQSHRTHRFTLRDTNDKASKSREWEPGSFRSVAIAWWPIHSRLASHLAQHVVYDLAVLVLRTKQNDLGVFTDFRCVSGRPVE